MGSGTSGYGAATTTTWACRTRVDRGLGVTWSAGQPMTAWTSSTRTGMVLVVVGGGRPAAGGAGGGGGRSR